MWRYALRRAARYTAAMPAASWGPPIAHPGDARDCLADLLARPSLLKVPHKAATSPKARAVLRCGLEVPPRSYAWLLTHRTARAPFGAFIAHASGARRPTMTESLGPALAVQAGAERVSRTRPGTSRKMPSFLDTSEMPRRTAVAAIQRSGGRAGGSESSTRTTAARSLHWSWPTKRAQQSSS
jgi:hypothetical protein